MFDPRKAVEMLLSHELNVRASLDRLTKTGLEPQKSSYARPTFRSTATRIGDDSSWNLRPGLACSARCAAYASE